jgi:hypothetical protein
MTDDSGRCDAKRLLLSVVQQGRRLKLLAEGHIDADVQRFSGTDSMGPGESTSDEDISGEVDQGGPSTVASLVVCHTLAQVACCPLQSTWIRVLDPLGSAPDSSAADSNNFDVGNLQGAEDCQGERVATHQRCQTYLRMATRLLPTTSVGIALNTRIAM